MSRPKLIEITVYALLLCCTGTLSAQKTNTWKGGAPGRESDWNCPKNWSTGAVPDDFSDVIIPDIKSSNHPAPLLRAGLYEVNALLLYPGAVLNLAPSARLVVYARVEGLNAESLRGEGRVEIEPEEEGGRQVLVLGRR